MKECDVRRDLHLPGNVTLGYDIDQSETVIYRFNSMGFRCEEYDPAAAFRICIVGESNAVGVGLRLEDTFGHKLKCHIAALLQIDSEQVNLINLSVAGASADYCVRTLYRQVRDCEFDLLVCQLPHQARAEYIEEGSFRPCHVKAVRVADLAGAPAPMLAYCDYYNDPVGMTNLVKNALLAQAFLRERGIPYVLATQYLPGPRAQGPHIKDFCGGFDTSSMLWHQYFTSLADRAADGRHAGPRSHAAFAIAVLGLYGALQVKRGNTDFGRQIKDYAAHLRAHDSDWKFFHRVMARRAADMKLDGG